MQLIAGEKVKGETSRAVAACNDWLRMGRGRSYTGLVNSYESAPKRTKVPTKSYDTVKKWSLRYNWKDRAALYDATWEARANAERKRVFEQKLATDFGRVEALVELADTLKKQLYERDSQTGVLHNLWQHDPKEVGGDVYDLEKFNAPLVREFRAALDDIAKEVGGRIHKQELTGKDGQPLQINIVDIDYGLLDEE